METMQMPDAKVMAEEAIKNNPIYLKDSSITVYILMRLMVDYRDSCEAYIAHKTYAIKEQLKTI